MCCIAGIRLLGLSNWHYCASYSAMACCAKLSLDTGFFGSVMREQVGQRSRAASFWVTQFGDAQTIRINELHNHYHSHVSSNLVKEFHSVELFYADGFEFLELVSLSQISPCRRNAQNQQNSNR